MTVLILIRSCGQGINNKKRVSFKSRRVVKFTWTWLFNVNRKISIFETRFKVCECNYAQMSVISHDDSDIRLLSRVNPRRHLFRNFILLCSCFVTGKVTKQYKFPHGRGFWSSFQHGTKACTVTVVVNVFFLSFEGNNRRFEWRWVTPGTGTCTGILALPIHLLSYCVHSVHSVSDHIRWFQLNVLHAWSAVFFGQMFCV